jgi:hypothetical protein
MRKSICLLLLLLPGFLFDPERVGAQDPPTSLQPGTPVERTLSAGQTHNYNVNLEQDQLLQLVVEQRGIDVVVRVFSPGGRRLAEIDSPNGTDGPENVSVVADATGAFRIEVTPLGQNDPIRPGRYEIKIIEQRKATEEELQAGKDKERLKAKGIALLAQVSPTFQELRPLSRARFQIRAGQLLWGSDEKRAAKLMDQAVESVREFIAGIDPEQDYYENFQLAMQLRREVIEVLTTHDPEKALSFLRSTRTLSTPDEMQMRGIGNQELELELALVGQIAANDPKRAYQMAEDTLKRGYASTLVDTLYRLRSKEPELAAKLAHSIAGKLANEKLLRYPEAAYLTMSLVRMLRRRPVQPGGGDESPSAILPAANLISDDEYRELLQNAVSQVLAYSPSGINVFSPERNTAQNLLNMLRELGPDLERQVPGSAAAVEKKFAELNYPNAGQRTAMEQTQAAINNGTVDSALEAAGQAPREMRDQFYQQIANRAAVTGDLTRARQIITDNVTNVMQRQQALKNLSQVAIRSAMTRGKIDEVLRMLSSYRPAHERAQIISQLVHQIGPNQKKAAALLFLEQARSMLGMSPKAEDQDQMRALVEIAKAFSKYDANRAFEIVEPLVDQFNEISEAAVTLNGFGQKYYRDGELIMTNGNPVAEAGNQLMTALGSLAIANFERAKSAADRIHPSDARIQAYLTIAQQSIESAK